MKRTATIDKIATAPTYGREPHIVATATPPAATVPTAASVVAGILGRPSLGGMCGQIQPGSGRTPREGRFCVLDRDHTEDHSAGLWYSWPVLADPAPEPQTAVIEDAPLDDGSVLLYERFGTHVRAAYDPARLTATAARSLLRQQVGDFTETAR